MSKNIKKLGKENAALLIVDMQERFVPVISNFQQIEQNISRLLKGCKILDVPIFITEQYPQGLGWTIKSIRDNTNGVVPIEKLHFSAADEKRLMKLLFASGRKQIIIVGIETHVCIVQSALDFQHLGFYVHVVADATSSRDPQNREIALQRMAQHDITITCTESVLFELLHVAGSEEFKKISALLK